MERTPTVQHLQEQGCSVLCLDCPEGILFGIDYSAWAVGPQFMGVKLIPPGLHFIYCSASAEEVGATRSGFFLFMRPQSVTVLRWDPETEELVGLENQDEELRYADGVRGYDFDSNLGPYPHELDSQWRELTRHATADLVERIEPVSKVIRAKRAEYDPGEDQNVVQADQKSQVHQDAAGYECENLAAHVSGAGMDADDEPDAVMDTETSSQQQPTTDIQQNHRIESNQGNGTLFFSAVPRVRKLKGLSPMETTQLHMDRSSQLENMISKFYRGNEFGIIGELQLAYIAFLLGQNYDGFEQWKALLMLLCSCETAVVSKPELFAELLRAFFAQVTQAPQDLFGDDLTKENFLGTCALSLLELCGSEDAPPRLRNRCGKLRELLDEKFGMSTDDLALLGEDAPQIVELDGSDLVDLSSVD
jgi:A1 cistron-splicing factor AAR2